MINVSRACLPRVTVATVVFLLWCGSLFLPAYHARVDSIFDLDSPPPTTKSFSGLTFLMNQPPSALWFMVFAFPSWCAVLTVGTGVGWILLDNSRGVLVSGVLAALLSIIAFTIGSLTVGCVLLFAVFFLRVEEFSLGAGAYCWLLSISSLIVWGLFLDSGFAPTRLPTRDDQDQGREAPPVLRQPWWDSAGG